MEYWIIENGQPRGPLTLDDLRSLAITPDTPVWHDGLADWTTAGRVEALAVIFSPDSAAADPAEGQGEPAPEAAREEPVIVRLDRPGAAPRAAAAAGCPRPTDADPDKPGNYLVWCIVVTILFMFPAGIIGIIGIFMATKVNPAWRDGDVQRARHYSERAQWCVILTIVLGLVWMPLQILTSLL